MIHLLLLISWLSLQAPMPDQTRAPSVQSGSIIHSIPVIQSIADSGRCTALAESPSERLSPQVKIVPGLPPLLSFRYYEGREHHRYSNSDLVLDDAGH